MPGVIYKFENQNLVTFGDNLKHMVDLPCVAYFDFEPTTDSGLQNSFNEKEMYPICCCLVSVIHPKLDINCRVVVRSFLLSLNKLNGISYLRSEMIDKLDL